MWTEIFVCCAEFSEWNDPQLHALGISWTGEYPSISIYPECKSGLQLRVGVGVWRSYHFISDRRILDFVERVVVSLLIGWTSRLSMMAAVEAAVQSPHWNYCIKIDVECHFIVLARTSLRRNEASFWLGKCKSSFSKFVMKITVVDESGYRLRKCIQILRNEIARNSRLEEFPASPMDSMVKVDKPKLNHWVNEGSEKLFCIPHCCFAKFECIFGVGTSDSSITASFITRVRDFTNVKYAWCAHKYAWNLPARRCT